MTLSHSFFALLNPPLQKGKAVGMPVLIEKLQENHEKILLLQQCWGLCVPGLFLVCLQKQWRAIIAKNGHNQSAGIWGLFAFPATIKVLQFMQKDW